MLFWTQQVIPKGSETFLKPNAQRLERKLVEHKLMVLETVAPRPGNAEGIDIVCSA